MVELQPPMMFLHHGKGRTEDVLLTQVQAVRQPLDETGLARAQFPRQTEQFASFKQRGQASAPSLGFARRSAMQGDSHAPSFLSPSEAQVAGRAAIRSPAI